MRNKKGALSLEMIIMAILGLVVLVVLIFIFKEQVGGVAQKYFGIVSETEEQAKGEVCETYFGGRKCMQNCTEPYKYDLGTDFKDCKDKTRKPRCCASESGL